MHLNTFHTTLDFVSILCFIPSFSQKSDNSQWVIYCMSGKKYSIEFEAYLNNELRVIDNIKNIRRWLAKEKIKAIETLNLMCIRDANTAIAVLNLLNLSALDIQLIEAYDNPIIKEFLNIKGYTLDENSTNVYIKNSNYAVK